MIFDWAAGDTFWKQKDSAGQILAHNSALLPWGSVYYFSASQIPKYQGR